MTKPRVTATNRLADVIEVVELGRRTGLLMVERGSGEMLEEGAIYFSHGRAIYAGIERVRGQDALTVLGGWGACRFSFDPEAERPPTNLGPASSPSSAPASQDSWSRSTAGAYPAPSQPAPRDPHDTSGPRSWYAPPSQAPAPSSPLIPNIPNIPNATSPIPSSSHPSGSFGSSWPDPRAGSAPGAAQGPATSGALPTPQGWPQPAAPITSQITPNGPNGQGVSTLPNTADTSNARFPAPGMTGMPAQSRPPARAEADLLRRPRRAPTAQDLMAVVQNYRLSRAHRTLLMLADGEHNVLDIARLSSKQIEEVQALLGELEEHGLVYYYR